MSALVKTESTTTPASFASKSWRWSIEFGDGDRLTARVTTGVRDVLIVEAVPKVLGEKVNDAMVDLSERM